MALETRPSRDDGFDADGRGAASDEESVVITLDLQDMKHRAEAFTEAAKRALHGSAVRAVRLGKVMVNDSRMFLTDLRSSISVQRDRRVVISIRRSSIDFALNALLWSALLVAMWKILAKAAKKYQWGWEESFGSRSIIRRDRSLGGREVFVGKNDGGNHTSGKNKQVVGNFRRRVNPLDAIEVSRSEKEMKTEREMQSKSLGKANTHLPGWWPPAAQLSGSTSSTYHGGDEAAQAKASFLLKVIMEKRLSGRDFEEDDILQLRRICKYSRARVAFDTVNVRDSFYRAAVDMVLSSCGRSGDSAVDIGVEKAADFLAGLADNISLEAERAATMVSAAVAARTRSTFLQAWALHVQGKSLEAEGDVARLSRIHAALPPDNDSPEMEMVAQGLGRHLSLDERKHLLQMYVKVSGSATERVASEALGLYSTRKRS